MESMEADVATGGAEASEQRSHVMPGAPERSPAGALGGGWQVAGNGLRAARVRPNQASQATHAAAPGARADDAGPDVRLDELLSQRGMTLTQLSERVGITVVNLSVLKNGRAKAIRFSTLAGLCAELGCQPGDLLAYQPELVLHCEPDGI